MSAVSYRTRIRLKHIQIEGFKSAKKSIDLEFSDNSVSVVFGENGSGKTTLLRIIHGVLARNEKFLRDENVDNITLEYECASEESVIRKKVFVGRSTENEENFYDWSEFIASDLERSRSMSLGVERGISTKQISIDADDIRRFLVGNEYFKTLPSGAISELSESLSVFIRRSQARKVRGLSPARRTKLGLNQQHVFLQEIMMENVEDILLSRFQQAKFLTARRVQNALLDTLVPMIDDLDKASGSMSIQGSQISDMIIENSGRIIEALGESSDNNFQKRIIEILRNIDSSTISKTLENPLLTRLLVNMVIQLESEKIYLDSTNRLSEIFNSLVSDSKKLFISLGDIHVETKDGSHSLSELSSGERHLITFLALLIVEGQNRDILIIDEPEISLNIEWQRGLISLFSEIIPNTQVIIASHSPIISRRQPDSLVRLLPTWNL